MTPGRRSSRMGAGVIWPKADDPLACEPRTEPDMGARGVADPLLHLRRQRQHGEVSHRHPELDATESSDSRSKEFSRCENFSDRSEAFLQLFDPSQNRLLCHPLRSHGLGNGTANPRQDGFRPTTPEAASVPKRGVEATHWCRCSSGALSLSF